MWQHKILTSWEIVKLVDSDVVIGQGCNCTDTFLNFAGVVIVGQVQDSFWKIVIQY